MDHIAERVTVTGKVSHRDDRLKLEMPVREGKGKMTVDVEGGYEVVEIATIARADGAPEGGN